MGKERIAVALLFVVACCMTAFGGFAVGLTTRPAPTPHPTWIDYEVTEHGGVTFNRCVYHVADGTTRVIELSRSASCPTRAPGT